MSSLITIVIFGIFSQYLQFVNVDAAPEDIIAPSDFGLKHSSGQFQHGYDQVPVPTLRRSLQSINKYVLHLKEYPNYAVSINLRNTTQFPCIKTPATTCSLVLTPPENHGLIVLVQRLNIRLNIRPALGEVCTLPSTAASWPPHTPSCQCRDYLRVYGAGVEDLSAKLCGRFDRKQRAVGSTTRVPLSYFVGESTQYLFPVNDHVRLTLFRGYDSPHDDGSYMWDTNGDIGGAISVTSYFDCSRLNSWDRLGYKNCSPSASGPQCISSSLFCDGVTNCKYDESSQSEGQDETNCSSVLSPNPVSVYSAHSSELLPVGDVPVTLPTTIPSQTAKTTMNSITHLYKTIPTPVSVDDNGIPVYTYRDIRKQTESSKSRQGTTSFPAGSNYLTTTFVFIVFCVVVLLTLFFGCLKLTFQSSNYDTNEPLDNARSSPMARQNSNASIDTIDRVIAATSPPPEYPEVSGLPSYDSLFREAAPIKPNSVEVIANYANNGTNNCGVR